MEGRCSGTTMSGHKCKNKVKDGAMCRVHCTDKQCAVCFSGLLRNTRALPCGHEFHQRCIDRWKRTCRGAPTCPMCRVPFDLPMYRVTISLQKVADGTVESHQYLTSNTQGIQSEFGLDARVLDMQLDTILNIVFDVDETEDIDDILRSLGVPNGVQTV